MNNLVVGEEGFIDTTISFSVFPRGEVVVAILSDIENGWVDAGIGFNSLGTFYIMDLQLCRLNINNGSYKLNEDSEFPVPQRAIDCLNILTYSNEKAKVVKDLIIKGGLLCQ